MKKIKDFPDYGISVTGGVWSNKGKGKWLKPGKDGKGYLFVGLCKDGKIYYKRINRLVAEAFIPNPDNKPQVNHLNGIKTNNSVENLEWVTPSENTQHAWDYGLHEKTRKAVSETIKKAAEACKKKVVCIETEQVFNSATEASRSLGLSDGAVIVSIYKGYRAGGFTWTYLDGEK